LLLRFAIPIVGDPLGSIFLLLPELSAAGAAAEAVLTIAWKLNDRVAKDVEKISRSIVYAVMAAQIAGVMIGNRGGPCCDA
jgi:hypothetical protein